MYLYILYNAILQKIKYIIYSYSKNWRYSYRKSIKKKNLNRHYTVVKLIIYYLNPIIIYHYSINIILHYINTEIY